LTQLQSQKNLNLFIQKLNVINLKVCSDSKGSKSLEYSS
jgi:hypothetical protein